MRQPFIPVLTNHTTMIKNWKSLFVKTAGDDLPKKEAKEQFTFPTGNDNVFEQPKNTQPAKKVQEGDVGFVNQQYTLFRHKTVYQSLLFALRRSGLTKKERHGKVMQYIHDWGLEKCKDQYPVFLSGGQRQRTAILEQLLSSGYYMVLDEPFSSLDVGNILSVKKAFQLINQSHELNTIMFSTHDIELAVELADSIYVIGYPKDEKGEPVPVGTIVGHYDLKKMGLAWQDQFTDDHHHCVKMIRQLMLDS